jgi:hypothetical protein
MQNADLALALGIAILGLIKLGDWLQGLRR